MRLAQRRERLAARLVSRAVEHQDAVEVVDLVLDDTRAQAPRARAATARPSSPVPSSVTTHRTLDRFEHALQREAPLVVGGGLGRTLRERRVDDGGRPPRRRTAWKTNNRRSTPTCVAASPTPWASCMRFDHPVGEAGAHRRRPRRPREAPFSRNAGSGYWRICASTASTAAHSSSGSRSSLVPLLAASALPVLPGSAALRRHEHESSDAVKRVRHSMGGSNARATAGRRRRPR